MYSSKKKNTDYSATDLKDDEIKNAEFSGTRPNEDLIHMATDEDVIVNIDEVDEEEDEEQQPRNLPPTTSTRKRLRSSIEEEEPSSSYSLKLPKISTYRNIQPAHPTSLETIYLQTDPNEFETGEYIGVAEEELGEYDPGNGGDYFEDEHEHFMGGNMGDYEYLNEDMNMFSGDHLAQNYIPCDLCEKIFVNREEFNAHRYEIHGAIISICACPEPTCVQAFASLNSVKRHLAVDHNLPLESHYKKFENTSDFSEWIIFIQYATNTRFVMHNRQQPKRRQLLFCVYSDHRKVSNSFQRTPGMIKLKGCCPAHVNYTINSNGSVDVIYQMYHHGHELKSSDGIKPWSLGKTTRENRAKVLFPTKPLIVGVRPFQYLQIDIIEMSESTYRHGAKYSKALIVTDMFSKFMFGRSLIYGNENDYERVVCRLLIEIFGAFGLPEGYSSVYGKEVIERCMESQVSENFRVEIRSVATVTPCYAALRKNIELKARAEYKDVTRWPETLPAVILTQNQTPNAAFQYRLSPFEAMFGRRAWYKTHPDIELPWLQTEEAAQLRYEENGIEHHAQSSIRQRNADIPLYDSTGKPLPDPLKTQMLQKISLIEARCDRWQESSLTINNGSVSNFEVYKKFGLRQVFLPGDCVYVRGLNVPCEKGGFLKGLVAETCWDTSPQFPYRVHVEVPTTHKREPIAEEEIWPTQDYPSYWISAYDICSPSLEYPEKHYNCKFETFLCQCSQDCNLFASENCANRMSKSCCDVSRKECIFHKFYDPKTMPVDKFVESYASSPEKVIRKVAMKQASMRRIEPETKEECYNDEIHRENLSPKMVTSAGSPELGYMDANEEGISKSQKTDDYDRQNIKDEMPISSSHEIVEEENAEEEEEILNKDHQRLQEMHEQLEANENRLNELQPKGDQKHSEEFLILESETNSLRDECKSLKRTIDLREQHKKFKNIIESTVQMPIIRRRAKPTFVNESPDTLRQTHLIMEENQIFPLVSIVSTCSHEPKNENNESQEEEVEINEAGELDEVGDEEAQRHYYSEGHQQMHKASNIEDEGAANVEENRSPGNHHSQNTDVHNYGREKRNPSTSSTVSPAAIKATRTSIGRGILSRKGPIKSVATSIQNSIGGSFNYTYTPTTTNNNNNNAQKQESTPKSLKEPNSSSESQTRTSSRISTRKSNRI